MPTPLGHSLAGLAVWAVTRKPSTLKEALSRENAGWAALCVLAANLPDADFIILGSEGLQISAKYHHGVTHSIGFALAMGGLAGAWAWMRRATAGKQAISLTPTSTNAFVVTFLCVLSHVLMDLLGTDSYPQNGIGLPLLWPMSGEYYIVPLFSGIDRSNPFTLETLFVLARELLLFGGILLSSLMSTRAKPAPESPTPAEAPVTE